MSMTTTSLSTAATVARAAAPALFDDRALFTLLAMLREATGCEAEAELDTNGRVEAIALIESVRPDGDDRVWLEAELQLRAAYPDASVTTVADAEGRLAAIEIEHRIEMARAA